MLVWGTDHLSFDDDGEASWWISIYDSQATLGVFEANVTLYGGGGNFRQGIDEKKLARLLDKFGRG